MVRKEICYEPYWFIYFPPGAAKAAPIFVGMMANWRRMEYNYKKTHDVCFLGEKQEKNTNRKLIGMSRREKCVFWRRSKQKNTRRVFLDKKARKKHKPEASGEFYSGFLYIHSDIHI